MIPLRDARAAWAGGQRVGGMWLGGEKVWVKPADVVAPTFTIQPSLTGSPALGSTITVSLGAASGIPAPTLTGTLTRPGKAAATVLDGATFQIEEADQGGTITLDVTATNSAGRATASGEMTVAPLPAPNARLAVHIDADIDTVGERDDISAMALWLATQDNFDIVGLTASAPDSNAQEYHNCINAYEADRPTLIANGADPGLFKPAADLRSMVIQGAKVDAPAKGYWAAGDSGYAAPHAAAQAMIANAREHGNPTSTDPTHKLWVIVQGGYTTLAQAAYEAVQLGELPDFFDRIRVVGQPNYNSWWAPNAWNYLFGNMWPAENDPGRFGNAWMLCGYLQWHAFNRDNGTTDATFWNDVTANSHIGHHLRNTLTRPGAGFGTPHFRAGDAGAWFWLLYAKEQGNYSPENPSNPCGVYRTYEGVSPWPSQTVGYGKSVNTNYPNPEGETWSTTIWAPHLTVDSPEDAYAAVDLTEWYARVGNYMALFQSEGGVDPAEPRFIGFNYKSLPLGITRVSTPSSSRQILSVPLVDLMGNATGETISYAVSPNPDTTQSYGNNGRINAAGVNFDGTTIYANEVLDGGFYATNVTMTYEIAGLIPSADYRLHFVAARSGGVESENRIEEIDNPANAVTFNPRLNPPARDVMLTCTANGEGVISLRQIATVGVEVSLSGLSVERLT